MVEVRRFDKGGEVKMIVKGNINEVCKQLHALKKAFVENNVSLSEYIRIRKAQQLRKICSKQLEQIFKNV